MGKINFSRKEKKMSVRCDPLACVLPARVGQMDKDHLSNSILHMCWGMLGQESCLCGPNTGTVWMDRNPVSADHTRRWCGQTGM